MAPAACLVSTVVLLVLLIPSATKKKRKEEAYPWKTGVSSGHITSLKQSILETFDIYGHHPKSQGKYKNRICPCKQGILKGEVSLYC